MKDSISVLKDHHLQLCADLRSDMADIKALLKRRNGSDS